MSLYRSVGVGGLGSFNFFSKSNQVIKMSPSFTT